MQRGLLRLAGYLEHAGSRADATYAFLTLLLRHASTRCSFLLSCHHNFFSQRVSVVCSGEDIWYFAVNIRNPVEHAYGLTRHTHET
jgi:hypothetical protein